VQAARVESVTVTTQKSLFVDEDGSSIAVEGDELVFRAGRADGLTDLLGNDCRFPLSALVSVGNHASNRLWEPDALYIVHRDEDGQLDHFVWPLTKKGVSRQISSSIYPFIKKGLRGSFVGLAYTLTHRIRLPGQM